MDAFRAPGPLYLRGAKTARREKAIGSLIREIGSEIASPPDITRCTTQFGRYPVGMHQHRRGHDLV